MDGRVVIKVEYKKYKIISYGHQIDFKMIITCNLMDQFLF